MLVLDMIEILPPLVKYKYDTWRILPVKCYIDNSMRLRSYIRNVNTPARPAPARCLMEPPLGPVCHRLCRPEHRGPFIRR
jgi:hypothetical protein